MFGFQRLLAFVTMNAAKAYRKLKEVEETKLSNRLMLLRVSYVECARRQTTAQTLAHHPLCSGLLSLCTQLELEKSERKVAETATRTQAILEHQAELEARQRAKVEEMRKRVEQQQVAQTINQIARTRMAIIRRVSRRWF